ncbi:hypothetical protein PoB_001340700 [Plakobranchus ocellatus]|uniref:Uncharacterized protein n=1 Tax=Plakobranchus ocellatus TaxID=259542 RepID=A0AAV3YXJ6_9GAST|nr:hypothetical protein PoB_001340700 [Plakobranchus ocellatus]
MDQSVIHHPLGGLTQAAPERNRPVVGRILPGFWNWNHRSLPPRWGDVHSDLNVIKQFKKSMQAGFRKPIPVGVPPSRRTLKCPSSRKDFRSCSRVQPEKVSKLRYWETGLPPPRVSHPAEEAGCNPRAATAPPQACISEGPQQPTVINSAIASVLQIAPKTVNIPLDDGIHYHRLFGTWQVTLIAQERTWG